MADETTQGVHPFTVAWWQSTPGVFQKADRAQGFRLSDAWHGLNRDPRFITGFDSWFRANLSTKAWESSAGFTRTFRSTPNVPVHIRTWHTPEEAVGTVDDTAELGEGELGVMVLGDQGKEARIRHTVRNYTGDVVLDEEVTLEPEGRQSHHTVVTPDRFGVLHVTVQVTISVPDARDFMEGVHVGTQDTTFEELPTIEHFAEAAAYPMLRYLDGIGHQAGFLSDAVNSMYDGSYTNPVTAPENSLVFLAAILGLPLEYARSIPIPVLRSTLVAIVEGARPTPGSLDHIALTARQWLTGGRQVSVRPAHALAGYDGPDPLHTLVVYVRADELPNNDLAGFTQFLNDSGVIPAGHRVIALEASQSWNAWENAYGTDWASKDTHIRTWNENESAGVNLDYNEGA